MAQTQPILFNGPMVRALLAGTKTQTRRVVKLRGELPDFFGARQTVDEFDPAQWGYYVTRRSETGRMVLQRNVTGIQDRLVTSLVCPYGAPGDTLWVREGFAPRYFDDGSSAYRADWTARAGDVVPEPKWKPPIHMPRWASRITLRVTNVRVQRVREISERDAQAEGAAKESGIGGMSYVNGFHRLWDSINAARGFGWDVDPWVWALSFERVTP